MNHQPSATNDVGGATGMPVPAEGGIAGAPCRPCTFAKAERMVSQKLIDDLFNGHDSRSLTAFPVRVVYALRPRQDHGEPAQTLLSVSKRRFKHAVDRNRVKRQLREAYRHHKHLVVQKVPADQLLAMAFIWQSSQLAPTTSVDGCVKSLLERIARKL